MDREAFEREGWLIAPQLVSGVTLQALREATDELERFAAQLERDTLVRGVFFEMQTADGRKGAGAVFPGALRKITSPSKGQKAFAQLRNDPRVLSAVESCGINAPRCLVDQVNFKLPRVGTCFPYHQDEHFLIGESRHRVAQYGGVNLVIALDTSDVGNGGFEVLGRTHRGELTTDAYDTAVMNHGHFDESHRVTPTLRPGDALLFHPRLAHGSEPNRSARTRRLITLWYGGGVVDTIYRHIAPHAGR
jgi:ectoine hydroxylase-related dioxygenase (phytanoyl-CoA dioxygenase family)